VHPLGTVTQWTVGVKKGALGNEQRGKKEAGHLESVFL
jgi:hypothetical protein